MNILMISENDPAGMGIAFQKAINKFSEHSCRLITTKTRYEFDFEKDIHVPDLDEEGFEEVVQLLRKADIIHFHILSDEHMMLGPIHVKDYIRGKAILHHHHGHPDFRSHPEKYRNKYRKLKRKALVSTPDLLHLLPEATWQPNLVPINDTPYLPFYGNEDGHISICQSPTRKDLKNTAELHDVLVSLKKDHGLIEEVIIQKMRHLECLSLKRKCDIHFDHMQGYYGVSSLEGLSQGKPVIAGLDAWNIRHLMVFTQGEQLPWVLARDRNELRQALERLITNESYRLEIGYLSRHFIEELWNEPRVLKSLLKVYGEL